MYPKKGYTIFYGIRCRHEEKVRKRGKETSTLGSEKTSCLVLDLKEKGPEQPKWQNYSKLSSTEYHCHLGTSWAACWRHQKKTITIEVYYVGSREKAPY